MQSNIFPYKRILVVGCGGAGKSTLAVEMGKKFALPVVHLDKLWWLSGWKHRTEEEFDCLLEKELAAESWIIDGNFSRTFSKRLAHAQLCIFLDYPQSLCINSVYARFNEYGGRTRPDMAEGCIERVDAEFAEWIKSYGERTRPEMLEILQTSSVPCKIFASREETALWLKGFDERG